ncbi:MAG: hypothetical protein ACREP9_20445, partial [Candidatus Dormibacteraceae bacterium]
LSPVRAELIRRLYDIAEEGPLTREQIEKSEESTSRQARQRLRQIESLAMSQLRTRASKMGIAPEIEIS